VRGQFDGLAEFLGRIGASNGSGPFEELAVHGDNPASEVLNEMLVARLTGLAERVLLGLEDARERLDDPDEATERFAQEASNLFLPQAPNEPCALYPSSRTSSVSGGTVALHRIRDSVGLHGRLEGGPVRDLGDEPDAVRRPPLPVTSTRR